MQFVQKQIIWAKVKGYPWWPAQIVKLPQPQYNFFKVFFIGEDTHAFLNEKDVKKYLQNHEEFALKKSGKLQKAIQSADDLLQTRKPILQKQRTRGPKNRKKQANIKQQPNSQQFIENQQIQQENDTPIQSLQVQSTEKETQQMIDRNKIDKIQTQLLDFINNVQCTKSEQLSTYFKKFDKEYLTPEQLCQSKVTKMLAYLFKHTNIEIISEIAKILKSKIIQHLNNTDYYDNCIKHVTKVKNHRIQFQNHIVRILKKDYQIKKQLAKLFAQNVGQMIGGTMQEKQLLQDLKERKIQSSIKAISSKVSVQRVIEEIIQRYQ